MADNQGALREWLLSQLPPCIIRCESEATSDEDELLVILHVDTSTVVESSTAEEKARAEQALIEQCRMDTKALRISLARDINRRYGYTVTWGMRAGKTVQFFTNNQKPVMTRLSYHERRVLDILIAANVANTRSAALSYIVRTFAIEHQAWLDGVQEALVHVEQLRQQLQPQPRKGSPIVFLADSNETPQDPLRED